MKTVLICDNCKNPIKDCLCEHCVAVEVDKMCARQDEITWDTAFKAGMKEAGLLLIARIGGIDAFIDWSDKGLREFRKMTLQTIKDLLKEESRCHYTQD